jgi:hypothetical protein
MEHDVVKHGDAGHFLRQLEDEPMVKVVPHLVDDVGELGPTSAELSGWVHGEGVVNAVA